MRLASLVVAQDLATATCGLLNAGYFVAYWLRPEESRSRRVAAFALALVSSTAVVEALFSQALFWWQQGLSPLGELSPGGWALARLPLLAATVFISMLVLRRLRS